ncbi:hypothetical protein F4810DRAFT_675280 [Camillea tinctor]|nr:hypothetical protein F4810DRAFT_675280 [Camillea tinctor]
MAKRYGSRFHEQFDYLKFSIPGAISTNGDHEPHAPSSEGSGFNPFPEDSDEYYLPFQITYGKKRGASEIGSDGRDEVKDGAPESDTDMMDGVGNGDTQTRKIHPCKKLRAEMNPAQNGEQSGVTGDQQGASTFIPNPTPKTEVLGFHVYNPPSSQNTSAYRSTYLASGHISVLKSVNRTPNPMINPMNYPAALFARIDELYAAHGDKDDELFSIATADTRLPNNQHSFVGPMTLQMATEHALDMFRAKFEDANVAAVFDRVVGYQGNIEDLWQEAEVPGIDYRGGGGDAPVLSWTLGVDGLLVLYLTDRGHTLSVGVVFGDQNWGM